MNSGQEILEKWIERLAESPPGQAVALRSPQPDPFCNPVAYTMRQSLSLLWEQLLGEMDPGIVGRALDTVVRIRAVQDISRDEAVSFVAELRPLLSQLPTNVDRTLIESRIDQLALVALDKYLECREHINVVRLHETERLARACQNMAGRVRP